MSFSVSLSLLTKNFEKGVRSVQASLNKLKGQFTTLMSGIGLGLSFKELVDSARKLDKAQTVLRNVSESTRDYSHNLEFVDGLSRKYNQELTTLMGNYAKFHSIATNSNMTLKEQEHIFESITRAAAFFNLSQDELNSTMLAVNQMMSKGKVSSEEFTRQLSERLPGTLSIVAEKYGVTEGQMLKMIQTGQVMANDLLPKLADGLDSLTHNIDVDTIEGATNVLRNSFTRLVGEMNIGDIYKKVLKSLSTALDWVVDNFDELRQRFNALVLAIGSTTVVNRVKDAWTGYFAAMAADVEVLNNRMSRTRDILQQYQLRGQVDFKINDKGYITNLHKIGEMGDEAFRRLEARVRAYNAAIDEVALKKIPTEGVTKLGIAWSKLTHVFNAARAALVNLLKAYWPLLAVYAVTRVVQEWKEWRKEVERVNNLIKDTLDLLDDRANKLSKEETELNLQKKNFAYSTPGSDERKKAITNINNLLGTNYDETTTFFEINKAINERLALLKEERRYQEVLAEISDQRIKKEQAERDLAELREKLAEKKAQREKMPKGMGPGHNAPELSNAAAQADLQKQIDLKIQEINNIGTLIGKLNTEAQDLSKDATNRQKALEKPSTPEKSGEDVQKEYLKIQEEYNNKLRALNDQLAGGVITQEDYDKSLKNLITSTLDSIYALNDIDENTDAFAKALRDAARKYIDNAVNEEYQKIQKEHNNKLRALNESLANGTISQEDYDDAIDSLCKSTLESIYALDNINEHNSKFAEELIELVRATQQEKEDKKETNDALKEYREEVEKVKRQFNDGLITQKELDDALFDLLDEVVKTMSGLSQLSGAAKELADEFKKGKKNRIFKEIGEIEKPTPGDFDATMSYKKDASDMLKEDADLAREYAEDIQDYIEKLSEYKDELSGPALTLLNNDIATLEEQLATLTQQADSFEQAAKFAEIQEDIKSMKKELAEGIWDNITGIASAAERLTNSWKTLTETMEDPETSGWEKFITIFTTVISIIETIVSVIKTFQTAMQVAEGLSLALTAAEQASIPVEIEKIGVMAAQAAIAKQVAVAKHMSAAASVPYPANLAAIASTSAALAAAFAAVPAFASGGVVPGNSTHGDKILARLNSGELVLNGDQQGALWNLLNGKGGMGGSVSFEIRGDKLQGVLNNYNKKIHK